MRTSLAASMLMTLLASACQPEPTASAESVSASTEAPPAAEAPTPVRRAPSASASASPSGVAELSVEGIGPVKLGMTYAELVWAGLQPRSIDGGVEVGPYRAGFAPARGGPIVSVFVRLGDLPEGLRVGGNLLKNETTSLQQLADAVGSCEPISPNIGQARTSCHAGRIELYGAGPVGGVLTITVKRS